VLRAADESSEPGVGQAPRRPGTVKELTGALRAGIFKESVGARNRRGRGLSYRPARLHRLAEFIPSYTFKNTGSAVFCVFLSLCSLFLPPRSSFLPYFPPVLLDWGQMNKMHIERSVPKIRNLYPGSEIFHPGYKAPDPDPQQRI
jgi:hypothetical protein